MTIAALSRLLVLLELYYSPCWIKNSIIQISPYVTRIKINCIYSFFQVAPKRIDVCCFTIPILEIIEIWRRLAQRIINWSWCWRWRGYWSDSSLFLQSLCYWSIEHNEKSFEYKRLQVSIFKFKLILGKTVVKVNFCLYASIWNREIQWNLNPQGRVLSLRVGENSNYGNVLLGKYLRKYPFHQR